MSDDFEPAAERSSAEADRPGLGGPLKRDLVAGLEKGWR
jgi:hypothetical protein